MLGWIFGKLKGNTVHLHTHDRAAGYGGFRIEESRQAIETVHGIRHAQPVGLSGDYHPFCKLPLAKHPFKK